MQLLISIINELGECIVVFAQNFMEHNRRFEVLKVYIVFDPEQVFYDKMVEWLQLFSLYHDNFLVVLNLFASKCHKVL